VTRDIFLRNTSKYLYSKSNNTEPHTILLSNKDEVFTIYSSSDLVVYLNSCERVKSSSCSPIPYSFSKSDILPYSSHIVKSKIPIPESVQLYSNKEQNTFFGSSPKLSNTNTEVFPDSIHAPLEHFSEDCLDRSDSDRIEIALHRDPFKYCCDNRLECPLSVHLESINESNSSSNEFTSISDAGEVHGDDVHQSQDFKVLSPTSKRYRTKPVVLVSLSDVTQTPNANNDEASVLLESIGMKLSVSFSDAIDSDLPLLADSELTAKDASGGSTNSIFFSSIQERCDELIEKYLNRTNTINVEENIDAEIQPLELICPPPVMEVYLDLDELMDSS
jgi:hypothetical protein